MDYKARMYDPGINRFVSPDSIIPSYANPQALNRFSYVNNRPVLLNDPSGHFGKCRPGMSGYQCKIRMNKAGELEQQWAQEAVEKKAQMIALQIARQTRIELYADMMLGNVRPSGLSGKPFVTPQNSDYAGSGSASQISEPDWLEELFADKNTPLYASVFQVVFGTMQEAGVATVETPLGVGLLLGGWVGEQVASTVGFMSTYYQYRHNLNGVTGFDAWVTTASAVGGIIPTVAMWSSIGTLLYSAYRTEKPAPLDWQFPYITQLDEVVH